MIRRQLVNLGSKNTDYRAGAGALSELGRLVTGTVIKPTRALVLAREGEDERAMLAVRRGLVDAGFSVAEQLLPGGRVAALERAVAVMARLDEQRATADDVLVAVGDMEVCSLALVASRMWCGGCSCALVPTTLDAMVECATSMRPLDMGSSFEAVSFAVQPELVVCDLDLVLGRDADAAGLRAGYVSMLAGALASGRVGWDRFGKAIPHLVRGVETAFVDELVAAQQTRKTVRMSTNPSSRAAFGYGMTTARALRRLGVEAPEWQLRAEGMRFEARLAVDAAALSVDDVFEQDDRFEALGIPELPFSVEPAAFMRALKDERFSRANRFLLSLPRHVGTIRLSSVDDEILAEHAEAYLASRAELVGDREAR